MTSFHEGKKPNCKGMGNGNDKCRYRKMYTIDGKYYEKCAEQSFCFYGMNKENASNYVGLLVTFYPVKTRAV